MTEKETQERIAKLAKSNASIDGVVLNNRLIVSLPWNPTGTKSASGKTNVHASTRGNRPLMIETDKNTTAEYHAGVNVYSK